MRRNLRRGARRLRTFAALGAAGLIEVEAEESRESTPTDESEDDAEGESSAAEAPAVAGERDESAVCVDAAASGSGGERASSGGRGDAAAAAERVRAVALQPRVPRADDRATTSFLVLDGIHSVTASTAFGLVTTHFGKHGFTIRRGAPFGARRVRARERGVARRAFNADALQSAATLAARCQRKLRELLERKSRDDGDFELFTRGCICAEVQRPSNPQLTYTQYVAQLPRHL